MKAVSVLKSLKNILMQKGRHNLHCARGRHPSTLGEADEKGITSRGQNCFQKVEPMSYQRIGIIHDRTVDFIVLAHRYFRFPVDW